MSLNSVFNTMKREGYVIRPLELYLLSLNNSEENDRAIDVNAPSQVGTCMRSRYYARTGEEKDANAVDPRARRIFDNGTHFHIRTQRYMLDAKILLMDEVPVLDEEFNIQGHTDGILDLSGRYAKGKPPRECAILELKSINDRGFSSLKGPKPEHREQGLIYVYCVEKHRKYLREKYSSEESFKSSAPIRMNKYRKRYLHLKSGAKFTAEQKIKFQVGLHMKLDEILFHLDRPITKCIFLYEDKDNQDLKEYCVDMNEAQSKQVIEHILEDFDLINSYVDEKEVPPREGNSKSSSECRWCDYKNVCWVI